MTKTKSAKRKSPADFFKEDPNREHVLYKQGGKQPVDVTKSNPYGPGSYFPDYSKVSRLYLKGGKKPYIEIHNHPLGSGNISIDGNERKEAEIWDPFSKIPALRSTLPSFGDLFTFLRDDSIRSIAVYQHDRKTNETEGVYVIRKTKKTPRSKIEYSKYAKGSKDPEEAEDKLIKADEKLFDLVHYKREVAKVLHRFNEKRNVLQSNEEKQASLNELAKQLHLQIKYVPAKGFSYVPGIGFLNGANRSKVEKKKSLEKRVSSVVAVGGILGGLFFLSPNVTGNAIANMTNSTSNFLGAGLLILGLVAGYFVVKSRNN